MENIEAHSGSEGVRAVIRLLEERREKYRNKLESAENPEARGRAKECKDLIKLLGGNYGK